jgi:hypothetical protein
MNTHSFSKLDPDLHSLERMDPNPDTQKVHADPKHLLKVIILLYVYTGIVADSET